MNVDRPGFDRTWVVSPANSAFSVYRQTLRFTSISGNLGTQRLSAIRRFRPHSSHGLGLSISRLSHPLPSLHACYLLSPLLATAHWLPSCWFFLHVNSGNVTAVRSPLGLKCPHGSTTEWKWEWKWNGGIETEWDGMERHT